MRHVDSLLAAHYPELATRSDTTTALVGIVFDDQWRVRRRAVRVGVRDEFTGETDGGNKFREVRRRQQSAYGTRGNALGRCLSGRSQIH